MFYITDKNDKDWKLPEQKNVFTDKKYVGELPIFTSPVTRCSNCEVNNIIQDCLDVSEYMA